MRSNHRSLHRLTRALPLAVALSAFALAGCAGIEVLGNDSTLVGTTGTGGGVITGGGSGGGSHASAMVGQWTRAILVAGPDGDIHESRTTWEFRADRAGTFAFYSNLTNDSRHAQMRGELVVRGR